MAVLPTLPSTPTHSLAGTFAFLGHQLGRNFPLDNISQQAPNPISRPDPSGKNRSPPIKTHKKKTKAPIATIAVYVTPCDRKERGANPNWRQLRSPESPVSIKKWRLKTCLFCKQNSWNTRPRCHFVVRKKKHREKITAIREWAPIFLTVQVLLLLLLV